MLNTTNAALSELSNWLTLDEAARELGTSTKTIERRIALGEIEAGKRATPGKKPVTVCHPEDVAKYKPDAHLMPVSAKSEARALAPSVNPLDALAAMLGAVLSARPEPTPAARWLTLAEASARSGLSPKILERAIRRKLLNAVKDGSEWKIKSSRLDEFDASGLRRRPKSTSRT